MKYTVLIITALFSLNGYSQTRKIQGKIIDSAERKGIPYATVRLLNSKASTVSNAEGMFRLSESITDPADTLLVSSIGYSSVRIPVDAYRNQPGFEIFLPAAIQPLREVVVRPDDVRSILAEAIAISDRKYPAPVLLKGYYREAVKIDSSLSKFSDGMIDYYIARKSKPEVQVRVNQSRVKEIPAKDESDVIDLESRFLKISDLGELISPAAFFDTKKIKYYEFQLAEIVSHDRPVYRVDLKPVKAGKDAVSSGSIFIDKETGLIMGADFYVAPADHEHIGSVSLLGITVSGVSLNTSVRYQYDSEKDLYTVAQASRGFGVKISSKKISQLSEFKSEFFATEPPVTDPQKPADRYSKKFLYKNGSNYESEFWMSDKIGPVTLQESRFMGH